MRKDINSGGINVRFYTCKAGSDNIVYFCFIVKCFTL